MAELEDTIREAAAGPKSVSNDSGSATARDVDELIKADEYLANKTAGQRRRGAFGGARRVKLIPPSAD